MSTNAARQRRYYTRRLAKGDRRLSVWLSEQGWKRLDKLLSQEPYCRLNAIEGRDRVITEALAAWESQRLEMRRNRHSL